MENDETIRPMKIAASPAERGPTLTHGQFAAVSAQDPHAMATHRVHAQRPPTVKKSPVARPDLQHTDTNRGKRNFNRSHGKPPSAEISI